MSKIKRGVSFYSYNYEYCHGKMNLEDCIRETVAAGASGIEMLAMQMVPGYPDPDLAFIKEWTDLMEKYQTTPVCLDLFNSTDPYKGRLEDTNELAILLAKDIRLAAKLGFKFVRVAADTPAIVAEKVIDLAEKLDIGLGYEIHPPLSMRSKWMEDRLDIIRRLDTKHIGFIPDMGIFTKKVNPLLKQRFIYQGVREEITEKICYLYEQGMCQEETETNMEDLNLTSLEKSFLYTVYRNNYDQPEDLKNYMPYFMLFHGKFYEMDEQCRETSLDYEMVMPVLLDAGYDGYICSEYEGARELMKMNTKIESCEQVRRHHAMLKKWCD